MPALSAGVGRLLGGAADKNSTSLEKRLGTLQRALPAAIILAVLAYELIFELWFHDRFVLQIRFTLEILIFGFFGSLITYETLGWIRERLMLEEETASAVREQERHLAAITANSADAIIFLDNDGLIRSWNRGAEEMFGYPAGDVVGRHFRLLMPDRQVQEGELDYLQGELEKRGFVRDYVTQRRTKDGRTLIVEITRTLLHDEKGQIIGSTATLRDVTERERAEAEIRSLNRHLEAQVTQRTRELSDANRELRQRQRELEKANAELKQLDKLKSEFVSMVSHELRAPLTNISGSLQLLLEDDNSRLRSSQREILVLANEQVERLERLVKGILNVSRIEAGQMEFSFQAFDMLDLIERTTAQWAACDSSHRYRTPNISNLPSVWADRDRVEEVLTNLLENAFKYSREGTEISIDAQVVNEQLAISVSDQGEGISSEELNRIFDKFYRVERDDARKTYGYGLGLFISRKLIEAMGGQLWGESELGRGSTFSFSLPLAGHADVSRPALNINSAIAER